MENESWRDKLKALEDGTIRFKTRLAEILASNFTKEQLEQLEYFQNRFLKMDEQIGLLRHEVREQLYLLQQSGQASNVQWRRTMDLQKKLDVKMIIIHENFDKLSLEFDGYLQHHITGL
ncbi:hypothetical protein F0L74_29415 [Chitinophaga agrisoli]|uniref:Uncharacterized protein n=1 Tax=Chitinophaga agrisoli TaxID=2607653 RepID=A0A5B2VPF2_9BACT|nr:hypothetical protein [Chitinophaga agrisoli]KAA2240286.1 hypothetical protein F0L74_29415 [Chitinophaga agrisoli]